MNNPATFTERSALRFERSLPGPIERVWSYLTDPKYLRLWFSDGRVADHVGGEVRFDMEAEGRITAFDPPHVLEYTWNEAETSHGSTVDSLLRWELAQEGDRVRLTLTHSRLPEASLASYGAGWHAFLDALSACVEEREPAPFEETFARLKAEYSARLNPEGL